MHGMCEELPEECTLNSGIIVRNLEGELLSEEPISELTEMISVTSYGFHQRKQHHHCL